MGKKNKKKRTPPPGGSMGAGLKSATTAAGLARRLGIHRGTVSRALRRISGGTKTRMGHYFVLNAGKQANVKKVLRKKG